VAKVDDIVSKLDPDRQKREWDHLIAVLDQAGWALVRKPVLREKGKPKPRPYA